jgi:hypothetical protein
MPEDLHREPHHDLSTPAGSPAGALGFLITAAEAA